VRDQDAGRRRWPLLVFRGSITAAALLVFNQAVFAGQFLAGTYGSLHTHRENATYAGLAVLVSAAAAVLLRWPGAGPLWPAVACLGLFGLIGLQIALGFARVLTVHVPLGVTIILLTVLLTIWAWRPRAGSVLSAPRGGRAPGAPAAAGAGGGAP
jgi:hypothetical protein